MKIAFVALLAVHLLIHSIGFLKAFDLTKLPESTLSLSRFQGLVWLATGLLFIVVIILYLQNNPIWSILAVSAVIISQVLIFINWSDTKFGTIANLIILFIAIVHFAGWQFEKTYKSEVAHRIVKTPEKQLTQEDIAHLPEVIKQHLELVGAIGKPQVRNVKIVFEGEMRERNKDWFRFSSEQFNFTGSPARFFFMKANFKGLPTGGFHSFKSSGARMQVRPLSIFSAVDHSTPELFTTEMITYLNDICLFAPAALIDKRIEWEKIDELTVKAIFRLGEKQVSAILEFNQNGQLENFISEDRYEIGLMQKLKFSTPVNDFKNINGYNLPSYGEAIWHYPDEEFVYGRFRLKDLQYNVTSLE